MLEKLFANLVEITVIMSFLIVVFLLLTPLLRRKYAAKWRCWAWMLISLRLLIPVNFSIPQAPVQVQIPNQTVLWVPAATNTAGVTQLPAASPAVGTTDGTANERAYAIDNLFWEFTESLR